VALPAELLESCHCSLHEDIAHRLDSLLLHAGQHVRVRVKRHAIFASSLALAHAGATLNWSFSYLTGHKLTEID
jgi:hypothetical protein